MNLRSLLFSILFTCAACAPTQSGSKWKPLPPLPPDQLSIHPLPGSSLSSPDDTCGVKKAWQDRGKIIQSWPDVDAAHETTFKGRPAVITKETVSLGRNRFISNELNALELINHLLRYTTERNGLHMTYYIVRTWLTGDSWQTASRKGLSQKAAESFITTSDNLFRRYGIVPNRRRESTDVNLYLYFKNEDNEYIGAVPISWKQSSIVGRNKLKGKAEPYYCKEKWK